MWFSNQQAGELLAPSAVRAVHALGRGTIGRPRSHTLWAASAREDRDDNHPTHLWEGMWY